MAFLRLSVSLRRDALTEFFALLEHKKNRISAAFCGWLLLIACDFTVFSRPHTPLINHPFVKVLKNKVQFFEVV